MSKIKKYKQWHLALFDENDIEYVRDLGCTYEVHDSAKTIEVPGPNGQIYHIKDPTSSYGLEFITANERQETMIQLKYSGNITLLRMWYANEWTRYDFESYI